MTRNGLARLPWLDRLTERDRSALMIGALLVGPALAWVAGVRPYRAALSETKDLVAAERGLLVRERALIESAPTLLHQLDKARTKAERAERRLVTAANPALAEAELTDYLEATAASSRVLLEEIRSVQPERGQEPPAGLEPLRLAVRGESDLEGVLTFLEAVETSPLLLRIEGLSVEPVMERPERRGDDDDAPPPPARPTGVVDFTIVLQAFTGPGEDTEPATAGTREERP